MTICDNCIHDDVCGKEGHLDEAMIFCADKVSDVQPVKRGRWMWDEKPTFGNPYGSYICSECGEMSVFKENYCCGCGADMRESETTKG